MKSKLLVTAGLAALFAVSAWAQLAYPLTANVPFDFSVGKTTFSAGEYNVKMQQPGVLRVFSADGTRSAMLIADRKQKTKIETVSKLIFNRYGDQYFLSEVWAAGQDTGIELRKTATELEIARRIANPEDTTVVARKR